MEEKDRQIHTLQDVLEKERTSALMRLTEVQTRMRRKGKKSDDHHDHHDVNNPPSNISSAHPLPTKILPSSSSTQTPIKQKETVISQEHPLSATSPQISPKDTPTTHHPRTHGQIIPESPSSSSSDHLQHTLPSVIPASRQIKEEEEEEEEEEGKQENHSSPPQ